MQHYMMADFAQGLLDGSLPNENCLYIINREEQHSDFSVDEVGAGDIQELVYRIRNSETLQSNSIIINNEDSATFIKMTVISPRSLRYAVYDVPYENAVIQIPWFSFSDIDDHASAYYFYQFEGASPWRGRLPNTLASLLGINLVRMIPFNIHGYHDSDLRTNVGRVSPNDFKKINSDSSDNEDFTYLGLELEITGSDYLNKAGLFFGLPSNADLTEHFGFSRDASLGGNGFEMVSIPMTLEYVKSKKEMFTRLYDWIRDSSMLGSVGSMHIHFDRAFFHRGLGNSVATDMFNTLFTRVWRNEFSPSYIIDRIVGREPTDYCYLDSTFLFGSTGHHAWWSAEDRNSARTVEIRRYAPNLNYDDLILKIEFTLNLVKLVKTVIREQFSEEQASAIIKSFLYETYAKKLMLVEHEKETHPDVDFNGIFRWWDDWSIESINRLKSRALRTANTWRNQFLTLSNLPADNTSIASADSESSSNDEEEITF